MPEYDLDGNPIGTGVPNKTQTTQPKSVVFYNLDGSPVEKPFTPAQETQIKDTPSALDKFEQPTIQDYFRRYIGRHVPGALQIAGGALGAAGGGGVLSPLGTMIGGLGGQELKNDFPRLFGAPSDNPIFESARDAVAFELMGKGVGMMKSAVSPTFRNQLTKEWLNKHFPNLRNAEDTTAIKASPGMDLTVPQATGNQNSIYAKIVNPNVASQVANKQTAEDLATVSGLAASPMQAVQSTENLVKSAQSTARPLARQLKSDVNTLYDTAENEANKTVTVGYKTVNQPPSGAGFTGLKPGGPTQVQVKIPAPVALTTSDKFAKDVNNSIKEAIESDPQLGTSPETQGALQRIQREMSNITDMVPMKDAKGNPMPFKLMPLAKVKAIRDILDEQLANNQFVQNNKRLQGAFQALKGTLSDDINNSAVLWGPTAENAWNAAQSKYKEYASKIFPDMTQKLLRAGTDPNTTFEMVARDALSDPIRARQAVAVAGKEPFRDLYFKDLQAKFSGKDSFNFEGAFNQMEKDKELLKEFTNNPERENIKRFFRVAAMRGNTGGPGLHNAIEYREGMAAINVTGGALTAASQGMLPQGAVAGGLLLTILSPMQNLMTKVLMNPKNARLAIEAVGTRVDSPASRLMGNAVLQGLRGTYVELQAPDGKTYPGKVGSDGKVQIIRNWN